MPFCSNCGTEIAENIKFCGSCGAALQNTAKEEHKETSVKEAAEGHIAAENAGCLVLEIIIVSIIAGAYLKSWVVFGGVFLGLLILYGSFKKIAIILNLIFTLIWGVLGYLFGYYFNDEKHFTQASVVLCLIGLLLSAATHFSASGAFHKKEEK
ncbi:MAG: zinc-ribbon domain-containing protein [Fibromonadaceae bacterium]|jgi:hypothetical protein|nr:zinc-ribbon domain-containing protein [Fibromonadaceae bacterium]